MVKGNGSNGRFSSDGFMLETYFDDVKRTNNRSSLTDEELYDRIRMGDGQARNMLVGKYLRLVIEMAMPYQHSGRELDDLVQAGNLGLCEAGNRFDPDKGNKFSTYAVWWIREKILDDLAKNTKTIRLPQSAIKTLTNVVDALNKLENPNLEAIAENVNLDPEKLRKQLLLCRRTTSLDKPCDGNDTETTLGDIVPDTYHENPEEAYIRTSTDQEVINALTELTVEEKKVLIEHFGLLGQKKYTLEEIGAANYRVTKERVRQIETKALSKLRRNKKVASLYD